MRKLETSRLLMRNFVQEDWPPLQEMIIQYMSSLYAVYDHQWPTSEEEIKGICSWFAGGDNYLAIRLKEDDRFIGYICLNPTDENGVYHVGYCLNFNYHGNGYAFESCKALVTYAFSELKALKIVTGTAAENQPSCKLLNRLGMKKISEASASFCNDENGSPIVFSGINFELTRESWISREN